ncbi:hypothetical protein Glove_91g22 [Diversispora epigaea]|uniref:C2H2-type domain-containing protein n=1 Tax=Diversispora epigaea TaxID=1348612 RepID=A0A397J0V0_9GLOM|nr:hypothetical protein Glove_134g226 [Diversispora epigaea]RHZ83552.1 hypothetical protein Glove_91g22 [Diversispora epigaea]
MPSRTSYDKPFPCYLCNCSYLSKSSLSSHEKKKHNENRIVPHYQYFSYIPEDIVNHFRASFLQDVDSKLGFHRTTEGIKKFQWKFPEGLFYFLFSNESGFSYRPSIRKYYCIFKGESGYKRIGTIFRCEVWGKKQNKLGSESFVLVEERDSNSIYHEKEIIFTWREKIVTKVENEKSFYVPCGILECILEVRRETVEIINI